MTRAALIVILLCAVCGAAYGIWANSQQRVPTKPHEIRHGIQVVRIISRVKKGSAIDKSNAAERFVIDTSPEYVDLQFQSWVPSLGMAVGRKANKNLEGGSILLMSDLDSAPSGYIRIMNSGGAN